MSPRLAIWGACRALAVRARPAAQPRFEALWRSTNARARHYSDEATPSSTSANAFGKTSNLAEDPTESDRTPGEKAGDAAEQLGGEQTGEVQPGEVKTVDALPSEDQSSEALPNNDQSSDALPNEDQTKENRLQEDGSVQV